MNVNIEQPKAVGPIGQLPLATLTSTLYDIMYIFVVIDLP